MQNWLLPLLFIFCLVVTSQVTHLNMPMCHHVTIYSTSHHQGGVLRMLGFWGGDEDEDWGGEDEDDGYEGGGPFNMITANDLEGSSEEDYYGEDYDL